MTVDIPAEGAKKESKSGRLNSFVGMRCRQLNSTNPEYQGVMGRLRRVDLKNPEPLTFSKAVGDLEPTGTRWDTTREQAALAALALYAFHQQSVDSSAHVRGVGLGTAMHKLAGKRDNASSLEKRFQAASTATTIEEAYTHLRSIVQQLKNEGIGLDYGILAVDLWAISHPDPDLWGQKVRQWGRDYAGTTSIPDADEDAA